MPSPIGYELIDFGEGARLERFGVRVVDRPYAGTFGPRQAPGTWREADLHFDRDRGWSGPGLAAGAWLLDVGDLRLELRPTDAGQVGLFPEHLGALEWLRGQVVDRVAGGADSDVPPAILHLFAYTGLATLAMVATGAAVTHVDASRPTVGWARHNAELSGLATRPIRWIVDDAVAFTEREARRGRRYAGIVLDPPTYGHGPGATPWRLEDDLARLLAACRRVLEPNGFVLLTGHTPGFDPGRLAGLLVDAGLTSAPADVDAGELVVTAADGRALELGAFARAAGGA
jgi:23S rRNA (cytosine1962-C5)-methyltransferase